MRGRTTPKSRRNEASSALIFSVTASAVTVCATRAMGVWVVSSATRSTGASEHITISAFSPGSPSDDSRYSVWPGKWNVSLCISCLLIGAVTSTSICPDLRSATARSSAAMAASPAVRVGCPGSTLVSSPTTLMIL